MKKVSFLTDLAEEWKEEMKNLNQIKKDKHKQNPEAENEKAYI